EKNVFSFRLAFVQFSKNYLRHFVSDIYYHNITIGSAQLLFKKDIPQHFNDKSFTATSNNISQLIILRNT
ncbi:hypothetical protein, partial [Halalkalibacter akibai]|uniref:hypothetical protein n=1 Tax=Halalkalibacter akibai TaxID=1411 RepID=UPI000A7A914E